MIIVWSVKKILKILTKNNRFHYDDYYDYYYDYYEYCDGLLKTFCLVKKNEKYTIKNKANNISKKGLGQHTV